MGDALPLILQFVEADQEVVGEVAECAEVLLAHLLDNSGHLLAFLL